MSQFTALIFCLLLASCQLLAQFEGGSGTETDPWLIATASQLEQIRNYLGEENKDKHFRLMNDIDLNDYTPALGGEYRNWLPIGQGSSVVPFYGTLDGNSHTICNLSIDRSNAYVGLFAMTGTDAVIFNLKITTANNNVKGGLFVGILAGSNSGLITNCSVCGDVNASTGYAGGLAGNNNGLIRMSSSSGSVSAGKTYLNVLPPENVFPRDGSYAGGLTGENNGSIINCYSWSSLYSTLIYEQNDIVVGDGEDPKDIKQTYQLILSGGLTGSNNGTIASSYASGSFANAGNNCGGLTGYNQTENSITDCYWNSELSGQAISAGSLSSCSKTTAQMKQAATFAGFDLSYEWTIEENSNYPTLRSYVPPICQNSLGVIQGLNQYTMLLSDFSYIDHSHIPLGKIKIISLFGNGNLLLNGAVISEGQEINAADITSGNLKYQVIHTGYNQQVFSYQVSDGLSYSTSTAVKSFDVFPVEEERFAGGSGTAADPFKISDACQLGWLQLYTGSTGQGKYFKVINNIDMTAYFLPNGFGYDGGNFWRPIGNKTSMFTGQFDGGGFKISGLKVYRLQQDYIGLFGYVAPSAVIKNVILEIESYPNNLQGSRYTAGLAGFNDGIITNSSVTGYINGTHFCGILVGWNNGIIRYCSSSGEIAATITVGGLVGENMNTIENCYSRAVADGVATVGGLVGYQENGSILNCYATGRVKTALPLETVGGIVSGMLNSSVAGSYWDLQTSGVETSTGSDAAVFGRTSAQMKDLSNFTGWDSSLWEVSAGVNDGYPVLRWQLTAPLPVELNSFTASSSASGIILSWNTATEVNNFGFEIERAVVSSEPGVSGYEKIGFVAGAGNSNSLKSYSFTDNSIKAGKYSYRLKQVDNDGQFKYSDAIEAVYNSTPCEFSLAQNYPNPFNPSTTIRYQLPEAGFVTLKVYDILGCEVVTLVNEFQTAGSHSSVFSYNDIKSKSQIPELSAGIYIAKLCAGRFAKSMKMMLTK